jgi:hypothetical protein
MPRLVLPAVYRTGGCLMLAFSARLWGCFQGSQDCIDLLEGYPYKIHDVRGLMRWENSGDV